MTTFTSSSNVFADSAAALAAWVQLTHDAMIAVGCVQTSDAGQLQIGDITEPTAGVSYTLGYRVYELNDALSGDYPVYIRLVFAPRRLNNSSAQFATPGGYFVVGFATDGNGNIQGAYAGNYYTYTAFTGSTSSGSMLAPGPLTAACKLDGYLAFFVGVGCARNSNANAVATACAFVIRRTLDSSGLPTGDGVCVSFPGDSPGYRPADFPDLSFQWLLRSPASAGSIRSPAFGAPAVGTVNGLVQAVPANLSDANVSFVDPFQVAVLRSAVTAGSIIQLSLDDFADHNYLVIPANSSTASVGAPFVIDSRNRYGYALAVRFE